MQTYHYRVWVPAKTGAIKLMNCQGKTFQGKFKASALDTIRNFFTPIPHTYCIPKF